MARPVDPVVAQLRALRDQLGLTQASIARRTGTPRTTYIGVEGGYVSPNLLTLRSILTPLGAELWLIHPQLPAPDLSILPDELLHDLLEQLSTEAARRMLPAQIGASS